MTFHVCINDAPNDTEGKLAAVSLFDGWALPVCVSSSWLDESKFDECSSIMIHRFNLVPVGPKLYTYFCILDNEK